MMMTAVSSVEAIGDAGLAVLGSAIVACVYLWPFLWPAMRARRHRLPRRGRFVMVAACACIGAIALFEILLVYPLSAYMLHVAPPLQEAGLAYGHWLRAPVFAINAYAFAWIPLAEIVISAGLTRWLAARWPAICSALRG